MAETIEFPLLRAEEVDACAIESWYNNYAAHTIPTLFVHLSTDFIDYLGEDSIFIPGLEQYDIFKLILYRNGGEYDVDSDTDSEEEEVSQTQPREFPGLDLEIKNCIKEMGGEVFPKLNWSSPKDAAWIAFGNSLSCRTPADVYLLLKSSDFITHDLYHPYEDCISVQKQTVFSLALREWRAELINPSLEFRCFIKDRDLIGSIHLICSCLSERHWKLLPFDFAR